MSDGDDVIVLNTPRTPLEEGNKSRKTILHFLRNQEKKEKGVPNLSLADFIAPESSGQTDNLGLFVVTADIDNEAIKKYKEDDYATIMIQDIERSSGRGCCRMAS